MRKKLLLLGLWLLWYLLIDALRLHRGSCITAERGCLRWNGWDPEFTWRFQWFTTQGTGV